MEYVKQLSYSGGQLILVKTVEKSRYHDRGFLFA